MEEIDSIEGVVALIHADVARILEREFSGVDADSASQLIEAWAVASDPRVQLAALKVAKGNLQGLVSALALAEDDTRDLLAAAEYPRQIEISANDFATLDEAAQKALVQADLDEYQVWLEGS